MDEENPYIQPNIFQCREEENKIKDVEINSCKDVLNEPSYLTFTNFSNKISEEDYQQENEEQDPYSIVGGREESKIEKIENRLPIEYVKEEHAQVGQHLPWQKILMLVMVGVVCFGIGFGIGYPLGLGRTGNLQKKDVDKPMTTSAHPVFSASATRKDSLVISSILPTTELTIGITMERNLENSSEDLPSEILKYENCGVVCKEIYNSKLPNYPVGFAKYGIPTKIYPVFNKDGFEVYCECNTCGLSRHSWTVIQRRMDGSVDFNLNWNDYVVGFGNVSGEHWLGLDMIHNLTKRGKPQILRIDLKDFYGEKRHAEYKFSINSSLTNYTLSVEDYEGTAPDSMLYENGMEFSTKDRDNDKSPGNCASGQTGGWWYSDCTHAHLNGIYNGTGLTNGIWWYHWKKNHENLKMTEMKIRDGE